eukprot:222261-Ditylum_brightwellii.AAC.1
MEGSSSASTSSSTRSTNRGIPLVAGLERCVKRGRHGTVQEDNPEESDSDNGDDLDKYDNAYTDLNYAALDKEDDNGDSDNFYESILSDEWEGEELTPTTNISTIPDHYNGPHGLNPGIEKQFNTVLECIFETSGLDLDYC